MGKWNRCKKKKKKKSEVYLLFYHIQSSDMVIVTRILCVNPTFETTQKQVEEETRKVDKPHSKEEEEEVGAVIKHCHGYHLINQITIIIHLRNPFTSLFKPSSFVPSKP